MNPGAACCFAQESKTLLFLKRKKQKDFAHGVPDARATPEPNGQKFFGSFFQERTRLLPAKLQEAGDGRSVTPFRAFSSGA